MPANADLQDNRNTTAHAIYALQIGALLSLMQIKYQAANSSSPFDTHYNLMLLFIATVFLYGTASVAEVQLARGSTYHTLTAYTRIFAGVISLGALLFILEFTIPGWIVFSLWWACFCAKTAYNFLQTTSASDGASTPETPSDASQMV